MKAVISAIVMVFGFIGMIGSALAIKFSGGTLLVLCVLELVGLISIGWWVLWAPLIMFFGGLFAMAINFGVIALAAAVYDN
jgi:hypothetical protein